MHGFGREARDGGGQGFPLEQGGRLPSLRGGAAKPAAGGGGPRVRMRRRMVGVGRFELPTSRSRTVRSSQAELHPAHR